MEHQSGCRPDLLHYNMTDIAPTAVVTSPEKKTEVLPVDKAISDNLNKLALSNEKKIDNAKQFPKKSGEEMTKISAVQPIGNKKKDTGRHIPSFDDEEHDNPVITFNDPIMQETGTKLMAYGFNLNRNKKIEEEKPTFRAPSLPLLNNSDHKEVEENSLSDSDEEESLEDFWRRADVKNAQRLRKIQTDSFK